MHEKVTLDVGGLALLPYADLEEGEYTVRVRRSSRHPELVEGVPQRAGRDEWAECRFSVAEFTLSPLTATLESHRTSY